MSAWHDPQGWEDEEWDEVLEEPEPDYPLWKILAWLVVGGTVIYLITILPYPFNAFFTTVWVVWFFVDLYRNGS